MKSSGHTHGFKHKHQSSGDTHIEKFEILQGHITRAAACKIQPYYKPPLEWSTSSLEWSSSSDCYFSSLELSSLLTVWAEKTPGLNPLQMRLALLASYQINKN